MGLTGVIKDGRRPSESFIPIAAARKGAQADDEQVSRDSGLFNYQWGPA